MTSPQESAPQIALINCSKEVGGKDSIHVILVKGGVHAIKHIFFVESFCWSHEAFARNKKQLFTMKEFGAFLNMRRYKN